ncbi:MAG: EpsG family protein [Lachnospiraceae bacterium]|nr:EpsG family protein [Lachnospiraceae bacterium]
MAVDRIFSIVFYMLIAAGTCVMAYRIQPYAANEPVWVGGERSVKSVRNRLYMTGIFGILFMVSALRFDIGNDYRQYTQTAHEAYVGGYVVTEAGFNVLVRFLYGIMGGEYYELVFAVFAFVTLYFFLKAFWRQSVDFSQTFFLFMMMGLYFQTFNTVRYYLALALALYSMKYVLERDGIKFVFWIVAAAFFHKSVLLVLPMYWIASFAWKKWQIAAGLAVCALCFAGKGLILKLALVLYPSYKNTIYLETPSLFDSLFSSLRPLLALALYGWFVYVQAPRDPENSDQSWERALRFYGQLNLLALVSGTFFYFLPVVTRISYYFGVSQLLMIPLILHYITEQKTRRRVTAVVYAVCLLYFMVFLWKAHENGVGLLPYRSWLFETQRYIYE